jgi:adenylate kinase
MSEPLYLTSEADSLLVCFRHYPEAKLQENLDSEIMEVLLQEARDAFDEDLVVELTSNTSDEMEANLDRIEGWLKQWKLDNAGAS